MPTYGRKVLGEMEFNRQAAQEGGGRDVYGSKVVSPAPEPQPDEDGVPANVVDILAFLEKHPERAGEVRAAEEARPSPRTTVMMKLAEMGA